MPGGEAVRKGRAHAGSARVSQEGGVEREEPEVSMRRTGMVSVLVVAGLLAGGALAGCEKGPAQRTGEKVDRAVDRLTGKGPAEKAGERVDKAVDEVTKK